MGKTTAQDATMGKRYALQHGTKVKGNAQIATPEVRTQGEHNMGRRDGREQCEHVITQDSSWERKCHCLVTGQASRKRNGGGGKKEGQREGLGGKKRKHLEG